jgi:hypothetical protein
MRRPVALLLALLAPCLDAATIRLTHPHGELIDQGPTSVYYEASYPDRVDCSVPPQITLSTSGNAITITVRRVAPGAADPQCLVPNNASLGQLSAGWWRVSLAVLDSTGASLIEQAATSVLVSRPGTLCGRHPELRGSVIAEHSALSATALADRVAHDAAFAALLGHPAEVRAIGASATATLTYDWLDNPYDRAAAMRATGEFRYAQANGYACFAPSPPDRFGDVVEFHHAVLDHYFYTSDASEIAGLDDGSGAKGWVRTGESFHALVQPGCVLERTEQAAYRFYGKPGVGPSSHFFTVDRAECKLVGDSGAWLYESAPFWASPIDGSGACLAGGVPLYRVWKAFGDSNHRFTTSRAVVAHMLSRGWIDEGPAMCVVR